MEKMIQENSIFETWNKKFFYEWYKVYNAETGEVVINSDQEFIDIYWVQWSYRDEPNFYLFFTKKEEKREDEAFYWYGWETCQMQWFVLSEKNWQVKIENLENLEFEYLFYNDYSSQTYYWNICIGPYSHNNFGWFSIFYEDLISKNHNINYPWKNKNLKKFSTEFAEKVEPPKDNTNTWSGKTEEPPKDWTQDQTIKNEIKTENQFFKDVDLKNFNFRYQEITKNWQLYIVQDSTEYQNYIANKVNEFTLFTYIAMFFIFTFLSFNFIKNILWK